MTAAACAKAVLEEWRRTDMTRENLIGRSHTSVRVVDGIDQLRGRQSLQGNIFYAPVHFNTTEGADSSSFQAIVDSSQSAIDRSEKVVRKSQQQRKTLSARMSELESGVTSSRNRIFELFTKLFPVASDILAALQAYMGHLLDTKVCLHDMMKETDDTIEELEESQEEVGKAKELMDLAQEQMETEETKTEQRMLAEQQHVSNDADDDGVRNRAEPDHSEVTVGEAQPMISCNTDHQLGRADDDEETHALSEELPPREHVEEQSDHGGSLEAADDLQTATIVRRDRLQAVQSQQDKLAQALEEIKREIKANKEILELQRTQILEIQREYRTAKQEEENNSWSSWCVIF